MTVSMPESLHDVLGERQTHLELVIVGVFGGGVTAVLLATQRHLFVDVPAWRAAVAALLIADVAAGCAANLTRGTSGYYSVRPRKRLAFIAVHDDRGGVRAGLPDLLWPDVSAHRSPCRVVSTPEG